MPSTFAELDYQKCQRIRVSPFTLENVIAGLKKEVSYTLRELLHQIPSLQEATTGWLNQYKKGRFELHHDTSGLEKPMKQAGSLVRQLILGILLTGIIVGSAIATGIAAAFDVGGSTIFTTIACTDYLAATIIAGLAIVATKTRARLRRPRRKNMEKETIR